MFFRNALPTSRSILVLDTHMYNNTLLIRLSFEWYSGFEHQILPSVPYLKF